MNELLVEKYCHCIGLIGDDSITHNMILVVIMDRDFYNYVGKMNFENPNIRNLFLENFKLYVDTNKDILRYLPVDVIIENRDNALYAVSKYENALARIYEKVDLDFVLDAVKTGLNFSHLPHCKITPSILDNLVTVRESVIDELPVRFVHDGLYMICMREHGMKLDDVPEEYITSAVAQLALELYPEDMSFDQFLPQEEPATDSEPTPLQTDGIDPVKDDDAVAMEDVE